MRGDRLLIRLAVAIGCLAIPTALGLAQLTERPATLASERLNGRPTRVLVLYSLAPDSPTAAVFIERLRTTMRAELPEPIEFYVEFLDLDRFPVPKQEPRLAEYLGEKYGGFGVDVVIAVGSPALEFSTKQLRQRLPGVPVVFGMVYGTATETLTLPANVTGRVLSMSLGRTLMMARRLQPDLERVFVIAGSSPIDSAMLAYALDSIGPMRDSVEVVVRQGETFDSLRASLRQLPARSIVFFAYFRRDARGQLFVPLEAVAILARESPVPIYGFADPMLERGVLGGAMFRHDDEGMLVGRLAVRVLGSASGESLPPVERVDSPFMVDWRTLSRFKLDERGLPPGTEIRFRVLSTWERYRDEIQLLFSVIGAQAILIGALLWERRGRRRAQDALRDQSAYERTMADLATDAVGHAPEDTTRALENALARVGSYAGADAAVLVQYPEAASRPESRICWTRFPERISIGRGIGTDAFRLELPLVVARTSVGALELYRMRSGQEWPPELAPRLVAAAEVIAGAIARSKAAAATTEAQRQVAHLGRVAIVGELGSTISHELRQPLTAIRVNAESGVKLLNGPEPDIDDVRELMEDIVADAARASATIEQIRVMLRMQAPASSAVDLNDVAEHIESLLLHDAAARGVRLDLALSPDLPPVLGNTVELQQAILNLVLNAFDAVDAVNGPRIVVIGTAMTNGFVEVFVSDTGHGLSAEARARLFQPFFTTKEHGLGMGLAIVRTLVEQQGGKVVAESNTDGGAIFRLIFPMAVQSRGLPSSSSEAVLASA